ncbi:MAG: hypothetical protein N5P05_000629 [Chroococcopsis gigantea SAG 12.99]|jgi:hypothetical protein|nr:hypothetical protein [Chroococcopsis gigantea SAG 12.99]
MNVRRQYSLPNCSLILEGLSTEAPTSAPVLSILTNAECRFVGMNKFLCGGRDFLENLVKAVSSYAQECLSGIRHPHETGQNPDSVYLEKGENNTHRLVWYPSPELQQPESPVSINLSTVQLFDLVEAVDQFFADTRTLPDLQLKLQPLSRRYRQGDGSLGSRVYPFLAGVGGLALCGLLVSLLPMPEVKKPEDKPATVPSQTQPLPGNTPGPR